MFETPRLALQLETGGFALVQSGLGGSETSLGSPFVGVMGLTELGPLRFGLRAEGSSLGKAEHSLAAGALAGLGTHLGPWRIDLLGQLAVRHTWDIPSGRPLAQQGTDSGSFTAPSAGGRLGISYVLSSSSAYSIGLWGFVDRDLTSRSSSLTSTLPGVAPVTATERTTRVGALLSVGVQFDLSPRATPRVASR